MKVVILGAGPAGLLLAHRLLARSSDYQVFLYEQRSDPRLQRSDDRAFVISLTQRGQQMGKLSQRFPNWFSPTPATLVSKTTLPYGDDRRSLPSLDDADSLVQSKESRKTEINIALAGGWSPGARPGDVPRGLGATAGVPIAAKMLANACATRLGESVRPPGTGQCWSSCQ